MVTNRVHHHHQFTHRADHHQFLLFLGDLDLFGEDKLLTSTSCYLPYCRVGVAVIYLLTLCTYTDPAWQSRDGNLRCRWSICTGSMCPLDAWNGSLFSCPRRIHDCVHRQNRSFLTSTLKRYIIHTYIIYNDLCTALIKVCFCLPRFFSRRHFSHLPLARPL